MNIKIQMIPLLPPIPYPFPFERLPRRLVRLMKNSASEPGLSWKSKGMEIVSARNKEVGGKELFEVPFSFFQYMECLKCLGNWVVHGDTKSLKETKQRSTCEESITACVFNMTSGSPVKALFLIKWWSNLTQCKYSQNVTVKSLILSHESEFPLFLFIKYCWICERANHKNPFTYTVANSLTLKPNFCKACMKRVKLHGIGVSKFFLNDFPQ